MAVSLIVRQRDKPLELAIDTRFEPVFLNVTEKGGSVPSDYPGSYSVTPGRMAVVLPTENRVLAQNITVNPIPSNYGLITYNGYKITVS